MRSRTPPKLAKVELRMAGAGVVRVSSLQIWWPVWSGTSPEGTSGPAADSGRWTCIANGLTPDPVVLRRTRVFARASKDGGPCGAA